MNAVNKRKIANVKTEVDKYLDLLEKTGDMKIYNDDTKIRTLLEDTISSFRCDSEEDRELTLIYSDYYFRRGVFVIRNGEFARQINNARVVTDKQMEPVYHVMTWLLDTAIEHNSKYKYEYINVRNKIITEINNELSKKGISVQKGGCYIATAIYGSYNCPQVWTLRRYRDRTMSKHILGRLFIRIYYSVSPTMVKRFGNKRWFTYIFRKPLDTIVTKLQKMGMKILYITIKECNNKYIK